MTKILFLLVFLVSPFLQAAPNSYTVPGGTVYLGDQGQAAVAPTGSHLQTTQFPMMGMYQNEWVPVAVDATGTVLTSGGGGGGGITSINADITAAQLLAVGTAGTDFAVSDGGSGLHTFNLPAASATAAGKVTTGAQTLAGVKTISSAPIFSSLTASKPLFLDSGKTLTNTGTMPTNQGGTGLDSSGSTGIAHISGGTWTISALVGGDLPLPGAASLGGVFSKAAVSHTFLTSISSADGSVGQAQPACSDLSNGATSCSTDTTNASNISSGTLPAGRLPALTSDVTSSAGSASTTVAKIQGTTVSGTTGTGNVVFSASPTLSGTAIISAMKSGNYHLEPTETNIGNSSTSFTVDWGTASAQLVTMTGNVTSITFSNPQTAGAYLLRVATGAGSFTATGWPGTVKWSGGTAPTITATASKVDLINFYFDGTSYYGSYVQNY